MLLLPSLFRSLTGKDEKSTVVERPCANCPIDCAIAGEACTVCKPYNTNDSCENNERISRDSLVMRE